MRQSRVIKPVTVIWVVMMLARASGAFEAGLAWVEFSHPVFEQPAGVGVDSQIDIDTGSSRERYSKIWRGLLQIPTDVEVSLEAEADDGVRLWIGQQCVIDGQYSGGPRRGTFKGAKGQQVPVRLEYYQDGGTGFIRLYWSWGGQVRQLIPASALFHSESDAAWTRDIWEGKTQLYEDKSSIYEPGAEVRSPMPIRPGPHLFIGDYLIESSRNVTRQVEQPKRDAGIPNPVVTGPQDRAFQPYFTVLYDSNRKPNSFRIWYGARKSSQNMSRSNIGYMESPDGIHWKRPALVTDPFAIQFGCSVIDRGCDYPKSAERYKFAYWYNGGLWIGVSADGLAWRPLVGHPVIRHSHDITGIFWDELRRHYTATVSFYTTSKKWKGERRITGHSFSDDLIYWERPWYILAPDASLDEGETQFYAVDAFLIRGPLKIGMVKILRDDLFAEPPLAPKSYGIGYTALAWTLDGRHWVRDRAVFFDRDHGTDPLPWDHSHAWVDEQVIVGDEVYLYYGGYKQGHKVNRFEERQIGLVKMPLDRYVARKAEGGAAGSLLTVPLLMDSCPGRLVVNANASAGRLRVQVRDADSREVIEGLSFAECAPLTVDGLRLKVRWGSEGETVRKLSALAGRPIRLEFEMGDAKLYAFDFSEP